MTRSTALLGTTGLAMLLAMGTAAAQGQAGKRGLTPVVKGMVVGACQPVDVHDAAGGGAAFGIVAQQYLMHYAHKDPMDVDISRVQIKLIALTQPPKHGRLIMRENDPYQRAKYLPDEGYYGKDRVEATVAVGNDVVRVVYNFVVQEIATDQIPPSMEKRLCPKGSMWKISLPTTSPTLDNARLQSLLDATGLNSGITVTTADLPGSAARINGVKPYPDKSQPSRYAANHSLTTA